MNFTKTTPCDNCPFRVGTSMSLTRERAIEIGSMMLDKGAGGMFPCHKTSRRHFKNHYHCAGAMIFAERYHIQTQAMQLAERFGMYDPRPLRTPSARRLVFRSLKAFVAWMTR